MKLKHFRNKSTGNEIYTDLDITLATINDLPDEAKQHLGSGDIVSFITDVQAGETWIAGPDTTQLLKDVAENRFHTHTIPKPKVAVSFVK